MNLQAGYLLPHPPLIIPQVGGVMEDKIKDTIDSYEKVAERVRELSPESLIIISPHAPAYLDYFQVTRGEEVSGSFKDFGAGYVKIRADDTILSLDYYGCNMKCDFCKNIHIAGREICPDDQLEYLSVDGLIDIANE